VFINFDKLLDQSLSVFGAKTQLIPINSIIIPTPLKPPHMFQTVSALCSFKIAFLGDTPRAFSKFKAFKVHWALSSHNLVSFPV
jgi:hypothetical protein